MYCNPSESGEQPRRPRPAAGFTPTAVRGDRERQDDLVHLTKDHKSPIEGEEGRRNVKLWLFPEAKEAFHSRRCWGVPLVVTPNMMTPRELKEREISEEERERRRSETRRRKDKRAATMIRRYAMMYDMRYMWSLTIADEVTDINDAWRLWINFVRRMKRKRLMPEHFVVVPELQKRGVWHFHVICDRWVPWERVSEVWGHGYIWMKGGDSRQASLYASKYVTKDVSVSEEGEAGEEVKTVGRKAGQRRFRTSPGLVLETQEFYFSDEEVSAGALDRLLEEGGYTIRLARAIDDFGTWYLCERTVQGGDDYGGRTRAAAGGCGTATGVVT